MSLSTTKVNILSTELKCSYRINKEMNHSSLDEDRALEPSNPQSAHIYRHGQCCCWFYLKLGNAGLRLQPGKAISRQIHVLQLKLVLFASLGLVSLVQKYILFNLPIIPYKNRSPVGDTCRSFMAVLVYQHCCRPLQCQSWWRKTKAAWEKSLLPSPNYA